MMTTRKRGAQAEAYALVFLKRQGLVLRESNYRAPMGEIDLIMQEKMSFFEKIINPVYRDIIFLEVRMRQNTQWGTALESVDIYKQQRILKTGEYYLQQKKLSHKVNCRFDIVTVTLQEKTPQFVWIKNAFESEGYFS